MQVTIANRRGTSFGFAESKKDKARLKRNGEFSRNSIKEAMSDFEAKSVRIAGKSRQEQKRSALSKM